MASDVRLRPAGGRARSMTLIRRRGPAEHSPHAARRQHGLQGRVGRAAAAALLVAALLPAAGSAAEGLDVSTPYPAVAVAPGSEATFDISVRTAAPGRVNLDLLDVPAGWTATLRGGGFVVDGVQTAGEEPATVTLELQVPPDASGSVQIILRATTAGRLTTDLPLSLRVEADAAGDVTMTTDFPSLRGPTGATYRFTLDLANDTSEDLTFAVEAQAPEGWQATAKVTGQEQAASAIVEAGGNVGLEVEVTPPEDAQAGAFPLAVTATSGGRTVSADLAIEITGSYSMTLTTPDDRLNFSGTAGGEIRQTLIIENTGTAPLEGLALSQSAAPTGWTVRFDPAQVPPIAPATRGEVTAIIQPSGDAIAGDYQVSIEASNENTSATQQFRVTVETSLLWGLMGIGLIVAVLAGLWFVFRRYGRR